MTPVSGSFHLRRALPALLLWLCALLPAALAAQPEAPPPGTSPAAAPLAAASPPAAAGPERWTALATPGFDTVGRREGLPNPAVTALTQDQAGFLWVGTQGGLARYDGFRFRTYIADPDAPDSLPDNFILALHEDPQGALWVGTFTAGLARLDPTRSQFRRLSVGPDGLPNATVNSIADDGAGGLWVATHGGLAHVDPASWRVTRVLQAHDGSGLPSDRVSSLRRDRAGRLLVATRRGLVRLAPEGERLLAVAPAPGEPDPGSDRAILGGEDAEGRLWFATSAGEQSRLWFVDPQDGLVHAAHDRQGQPLLLAGVTVRAITAIGPGRLALSSVNSGLLFYDTASGDLRPVHSDPADAAALPSDSTPVLYRDRAGLLWIGTERGLTRHDPAAGAFATIRYSPLQAQGLSDEDVLALLPRPDGTLVLGLGEQGIDRVDPDQGVVARVRTGPAGPPRTLPPTSVVSLVSLGDGSGSGGQQAGRDDLAGPVLAGTRHGLFRLGPDGHVTALPLPLPNPAPRIEALLAWAGRVWIGTADGLLSLDPSSGLIRVELAAGVLDSPLVQALAGGPENILWLGTAAGLARYRLDTGTVEQMRHDPADAASIPNGLISSLLVDGDGRLWIGTLGGGIAMGEAAAQPLRLRRFTTRHGLPDNNIGGLLLDAQGKVWASTANGMARIDPQDFSVRAFGADDGVRITAYWTGAAARTAAGELVFGGAGGVTVVRPDRLMARRALTPVVATAGRAGGQPIPVERFNRRLDDPADISRIEPPLLVHPGASSLEVEFAALDYGGPELTRYRYRLLGYDRDWIETDASRRSATYTNLPPGDYMLEVRGSDKDGAWSDRTLAVPVRFLPAWYQTNWVQALAVFLVLALVLTLMQIRTSMLRMRSRALEQQVAERTSDLVAAADALRHLGDAGRELTGLLDPEQVYAALHRHVAMLMQADVFGIALVRGDGGQCHYPYYVENGVRADPIAFPMDHPNFLAARAIREQREMLMLGEDESMQAPAAPGIRPGPPMRTLVFRPLIHGGRMIGVITVQSRQAEAFGARELEALRTIAAYGAIAIANARAWQDTQTAKAAAETAQQEATRALADLRTAQASLIRQEKLVSLGQLVAGVAHEINTPLGIAITTGTHIEREVETVGAGMENRSLTRSALAAFIEDAREGFLVLNSNLRRAADLVRSFKQVAADQFVEQQRSIDLKAYLADVLRSLEPLLRRNHVAVSLEGEDGVELSLQAGALAQVVTNLVQNAVVHAFEGVAEPTLTLRVARLDERQAVLTVADNGIGMPPSVRDRMFDPFFTTRRGQGGTGLGLHIVHNLVTGPLAGSIEVETAPGAGTRFRLLLGETVPEFTATA